MIELQRITTEYEEFEDRLRVSGLTTEDETITLWLTQRLLKRLLPLLFSWLEKRAIDGIGRPASTEQAMEMLQVFAQQEANAGMSSQTRVECSPESSVVLVQSVDINRASKALRMIFNGSDGMQIGLVMEIRQLRQWLAVVYLQWQKARWATGVWPTWMTTVAATDKNRTDTAFH